MSTPHEISAELLATMEANNRPKCGVHPRIPENAYHRTWKAVGSTLLAHMQRSPAHAKWAMANPPEPTPAMVLGSAIHVAVLEPDTFHQRYAFYPTVNLRTKAGKDVYGDAVTSNPGKVILKEEEYGRCLAARDAVHRHTFAMAMLSGAGEFELSAVWDQAGVRCKSRMDRLSFKVAGGTIVDLKSTRDARREAFEKAIFNYRYYGQSAHYLTGAQANKLAVKHYTIICVESEPPYGVGVYRLSPEVIAMGDQENEHLLRKFADCERTGNWPAYEDNVSDIGIPQWGWRQLEERIE